MKDSLKFCIAAAIVLFIILTASFIAVEKKNEKKQVIYFSCPTTKK